MSTKLNSIISDGTLLIDTDMDISFQTTFSFAAPHCVADPVTADDLTNKAYVDSRLVNSGSGTNLYFNYSVDDVITPYKQLGTSIVITTQTTVNTPQLGTQPIASFMTDLGYPGTVSIPAGIWELNQFGRQVGGNTGVLRYFFTLTRRNLAGTELLLGTSGYSADINTSVTDVFFCQLPLGILTLSASTDRLIVKIFTLGTATGVGHTLDSQFQDTTYSYITTPLVSGSNFLSLNNTFTGSNSFTNSPTVPTAFYESNLNVANTTYVANNFVDKTTTQSIGGSKTFSDATTTIGSMVILSNALNSTSVNTEVLIGNNLVGTSGDNGGALKIGQNMDYGQIFIGNKDGRHQDTYIQAGNNTGGNLHLGNAGASVRIGAEAGSQMTGQIAIGSGNNSTGTITLGSATRLLTVLGTTSSSIEIGSGTIGCGIITSTGITSNSFNVADPTNVMNIADTQTTGVLNIGTNVGRTAIGIINVGNTSGVNQINIQTASTNNTSATPAIAIGTSSAVKYIKIGHESAIGTVSMGMFTVVTASNTVLMSTTVPSNDISIGALQSTGVLYFGAGSGTSRSGAINFATAGITSCAINFLTGATNTGSLNIGTSATGVNTTTININTGTTTGLISIGNTASPIAIKAASGSLALGDATIGCGAITTSATPTAYPTVGSTVPTTTWVSNALTYLKANINTWDLAQTFTTVPINNGTIGLGSANDTNVPTTAWVQTALTYFKTQAQTWALAQTFTAQPLTNATIPAYPLFDTGLVSSTWVKNAINYAEKGKITSASVPALAVTGGILTFVNTYTTIPLVLLTVDMGSGTTIVSCALAGTTLVDFSYILSSLVAGMTLNYYVIVI